MRSHGAVRLGEPGGAAGLRRCARISAADEAALAESWRTSAELPLVMIAVVRQDLGVMDKRHRIAVVALDGVTALDLAIAMDVFTVDRDVP